MHTINSHIDCDINKSEIHFAIWQLQWVFREASTWALDIFFLAKLLNTIYVLIIHPWTRSIDCGCDIDISSQYVSLTNRRES